MGLGYALSREVVKLRAVRFLFAVLLLVIVGVANGQPININSCREIDQPGYYLLEADLSGVNDSNSWCIMISASNVVLDGNGHNITGIGSNYGYGIRIWNISSVNNVTIKNVKVRDYLYGVYLYKSSDTSILDSTVSGNTYGIYLQYYSNKNVVQNNTILDNRWGIYSENSNGNAVVLNTISGGYHGVELRSSGNNVIKNNVITENDEGIYLYISSSNAIKNNTISKNKPGIELYASSNTNIENNTFENDGLYIYNSYNNVIKDNTVNGKPLIYLENAEDVVVDNAGQVIAVKSQNITIRNLDITNTYVGVEFWNTSNSVIEKCNLSNNSYGVILAYHSNNNNIIANEISNNSDKGIQIGDYAYGDYSSNNRVEGNRISNNFFGVGVFEKASNNTISNNEVTYNYDSGIWLENGVSNTVITKNTIMSNGGDGISIQSSTSNHNLIANNTISNNQNSGIHVQTATGTDIINNTISSNNDKGVYLDGGSKNINITDNRIIYNGDGIYIKSSAQDPGSSLYSGYNNIKNNTIKSNSGIGIYVYRSMGNEISNNSVSECGNMGIYLYASSNNLIYNNLFNNTNNVSIEGHGSYSNTWNTTLTEGTNILGGNYIGGNAWLSPDGNGYSETCTDSNGDGICDTPFVIDASNIDYLPLAKQTAPAPADTTPPAVTVISPQNNTVYHTSTIEINVSASDPSGIAEVKAQVDGATNVTLTQQNGYYVNTTTLSDGHHTIRIFAKDNAGNVNSSVVVEFDTISAIQVDSCRVIDRPGYYVLNKSIEASSDCFNITANDVILDGGGFRINVSASGATGISVGLYIDNVTIKNLIIDGFSEGIVAENSSRIAIENVSVYNTAGPRSGIVFLNVSNSHISDCTLAEDDVGIDLQESKNIIVTGCHIENSTGSGIYIYHSTDIVISENTIKNNNQNGIDSGGIVIEDSWSVNLSNNLITQNKYNGAYIYSVSQLEVKNNQIINNCGGNAGIYLDEVGQATIAGNDISHNSGYGIQIWNSHDFIITSNELKYNNLAGLYFNSINNLQISDNLIESNQDGIKIYSSHDISILRNNFTSNNAFDSAIHADSSSYNISAHYNNFVNNTIAVCNGNNSAILNATLNWWNSTLGPFGNYADRADGNIAFIPWLNAPYPEGEPIFGNVSTISQNGTYSNSDFNIPFEFEVNVNISSPVTILIGNYSENPVPENAPFQVGLFYDIAVNNSSALSSLTLKIYYNENVLSALGMNEDNLKAYWFDGSNWSECSNYKVNTIEDYVEIFINQTTSPSIYDLTGTPISIAYVPPQQTEQQTGGGTSGPTGGGTGGAGGGETSGAHGGGGGGGGYWITQTPEITPTTTATPTLTQTPMQTVTTPITTTITPVEKTTPLVEITKTEKIPGFEILIALISISTALTLRMIGKKNK